MPFQTQVNINQAPAVAGDFASANPRATVLAGAGGLVAGAAGVTVGKFAWIAADGKTVTNYGQYPAVPDGFVHRDQQGLITNYLAESTMLIPAGFPVVLHQAGDFFAKNSGPSALIRNGALYASYADGSVVTAAPTGASVTGSLGSTSTGSLGATFTASAGSPTTKLVVTSVTGLISIGDTVSGTGITAGTTILSQDSGGTVGGAGTYNLSGANTCSSATVTSFGVTVKLTATTGLVSVGDIISGGAGFPVGATVTAIVSGGGLATAGVYTISAPGTAYTASASGITTYGNTIYVSAVASGTIAIGAAISGGAIAANSVVSSQVNGTPGATGTYTVSNVAAAYGASGTFTTVGGIALTAWTAQSAAASGELVKISTFGA